MRRLAWVSGLALSLALAAACASDRASAVRATASGSLIPLPGDRAEVDGQPVYTDRAYTFERLGAALAGLRYLATANDDKTHVARDFLELEAGSRTTIYLALDRRDKSVPVPRWLAEEGFQLLASRDAVRFHIVTSDREARFEVYVRKARGETNLLTLGGNVDGPTPPTASLSMYLVFYRGSLAAPAPDEVVRRRIEEGAAARAPAEPFGAAAAASAREAFCPRGQPLPGRADILLWSKSLPRKRPDFRCAELSGLDFSAASINLSDADLIAADLRAADLSTAVLDRAEMEYANLAKAKLRQASMLRANLIRADLSGARLNGADLSYANLSGAELGGADFTAANLENALFEPASLPASREIAFASGLEWLSYRDYPDALIRLRDSFKKDGFRRQERLVTAAIERQKLVGAPWYERWVRVVLLGVTCDYGSAVTRPLLLIVASILVFPLLYYPCSRRLACCKLQLVDGDDRSAEPRDVPDGRRWRYCFQLGLVSAFALGGPIDVGKWIERLLPTTISVRAKGWLRTLAGIQSLIGLALLTLWLLNFLGRPFE